MQYIRVISDMNLELIDEAFSAQGYSDRELTFLSFARPSALMPSSEKDTKSSADTSVTFFMPSMWHLFSHILANIQSAEDEKKIHDIIGAYINEIYDVLASSDINFIVLPRSPDKTLYGLSLGGAEYKTFMGWKRVWLNFSHKLSSAFDCYPNVVIIDSIDLFGSLEIQNAKARQRMFFELMVEHTWQEAQVFAKNAMLAVQCEKKIPAVKCICLDLDNTLWGGVLGDVGVSGITLGGFSGKGRAFVEIQKFFKSLKNRGYFLAIVSKNYIDVVLDALDRHPDMVLHREDFQIIYCGWGAKSDRIKNIAEALNIGEDAVVFFDDSSFERGEVKKYVPQVIVPNYSSNPIECLSILYNSQLFQTHIVTSDDFLRNASISIGRVNIEGDDFIVTHKATQLSDSSRNSHPLIEFDKVSSYSFARTLQLLNKTNQFNLTGNRFTQKSLNMLLAECDISLVGTVKDEFANYGLTAVILAKLDGPIINVQEFVMSCRVFGRGVELRAVEEVANFGFGGNNRAKEINFLGTKGIKNRPIVDFLKNITTEADHGLIHLGVKFGVDFTIVEELGGES